MVPIKVNKWNSLVQQVEENRQNILTLSEQPPQFDAKGEWNSTTVYAQNDMISYNGSSYFSLQDSNANHTPGASDSAAWWQLLAAHGAQGATGATGATGAPGPEGDPGPGVYGARIVDSTLQVYSPFVNAPAQGDLIIVDVDETTDANIGNMYIVTNPTGTSHIPLANVQLTGNIRGPKGDPGPQGPTGPAGAPGAQSYSHYISFKYRRNGGSDYYNFAFSFTSHLSTAMPFSQFVSFINNAFPNDTHIFCGVEYYNNMIGGYMVSTSGAGSLNITNGAGIDMPPDSFTIVNTDVEDFVDTVI